MNTLWYIYKQATTQKKGKWITSAYSRNDSHNNAKWKRRFPLGYSFPLTSNDTWWQQMDPSGGEGWKVGPKGVQNAWGLSCTNVPISHGYSLTSIWCRELLNYKLICSLLVLINYALVHLFLKGIPGSTNNSQELRNSQFSFSELCQWWWCAPVPQGPETTVGGSMISTDTAQVPLIKRWHLRKDTLAGYWGVGLTSLCVPAYKLHLG